MASREHERGCPVASAGLSRGAQAILLLMLALSGYPAVAEDTPVAAGEVLWKVDLGMPGFQHRLQSIATDASGNATVLTIAIPEQEQEVPTNAFWLWKVSATGARLLEMELEKPTLDTAGNMTDVYVSSRGRIVECPSGPLSLVVDFLDARPWLLPLQEDASAKARYEITWHADRLVAQCIVATTDGGYVIAGIEDGQSVLIKLDSEAQEVWRRPCDYDLNFVYVEGAAMPGGDVALALSLSEFGPSSHPLLGQVWIGRFDQEGSLVKERLLPGQKPDCAAGLEGQLLLARDTANDGTQDMHVSLLDQNMQDIWERHATAAEDELGQYEVKQAESGTFALGGIKEKFPYAASFSKDGTKAWEFWGKDEPITAVAGLAASDSGETYLASTIHLLSEGGHQGVVRLLRIGLPAPGDTI